MQEKGEKEESEYVPLPIHTSTGWTKKVAHFQHIIFLEPFDINQTDFTIALVSLEYCDGVTDLLMPNLFLISFARHAVVYRWHQSHYSHLGAFCVSFFIIYRLRGNKYLSRPTYGHRQIWREGGHSPSPNLASTSSRRGRLYGASATQ